MLTILCLFPLHATVTHAEPRASLDAIVQVSATVPNSARTARSLGTRRQGTGVVIDDSGLVLTIGYLILEAMEVSVQRRHREPVPANIVAYDHESGFGLVRTTLPLVVFMSSSVPNQIPSICSRRFISKYLSLAPSRTQQPPAKGSNRLQPIAIQG